MNSLLKHSFLNILTMTTLSFSALAQEVVRPEPEISTPVTSVSSVQGKDFMVVTANGHATKAAADILAQGGNAADAAIAAQLVLGLVEPQSSGLGGGAFVVYYDAKNDEIITLDGREVAPQEAHPSMFMHPTGEPFDFEEAVNSGLSVGVPGTPALLSHLYKNYGSLKKGEAFEAAIELAEQGFEISPRLASMIEHDAYYLLLDENAKQYFLDERGKPLPAGHVLKNPDYAKTLKNFRSLGDKWFYEMAGKDIARVVSANAGIMTAADMADYEVIERKPVCGPYRIYVVCSMDEPSSGGLTLLSALGMLERFDLSAGPTARNIHLITEASRLAFADRNQYMADPDFVASPSRNLIAPDYLAQRSALINELKAQTTVSAGQIDNENGTSHISIVDSMGNVLAMTTTIEGAFGSKLMTHGFLLNNEMTDFSFRPRDENGNDIANAVAPGKRPRSSMAPVIVFDAEGKPFLTVGSAGGSRIIGFVMQAIISAIDWDMPLEQSIAAPHFLARSDTVELESSELMQPLKNYGHPVKVGKMSSGMTAIQWDGEVMQGVADPRREGVAAGR